MREYIYKKDTNYSEPLSKEKLEILIRTDELKADEFVYLTDTKEWKRIYELEEFSSWILKPEAHEIRRWFKQSKDAKTKEGPYSTKDIVKMLTTQELTEHSYLWSYETKEWKQLKDIEDFNKEDKHKEHIINKVEKIQKNPNNPSEQHTQTLLIKKQSPNKINKNKVSNKNLSKTKKIRKHGIPEIIFGIIIIILSYIRKESLATYTNYAYILGALFFFIGTVLLVGSHIAKKEA